MKKFILFLMFLVLFIVFLSSEVENPDKPEFGEYIFKLDKIWEVEKAGEDLWGIIYNIVVSKDGRVCCYDWKNLKYYIMDANGKFITKFGKQGEGPGEIKRIRQAPILNAGNKIVVIDTQQLHFFNWEGKFINTKRNSTGNRPIIFLDEDNFITAPRTALDTREGKAKVEQINLRTKKRKLITTFSMYKGGTIQEENIQSAVVFGGITPVVVVHSYKNRLYYGISNVDKIFINSREGKSLISFGLKREKNRVKREDIVNRLVQRAKGRAPKELLERLAKTLPLEETYFTKISVKNDLIYVFKSDFYATNINQIDIFSKKGKYLYKGLIKIEEGNTVRIPTFTKNHLFLIIENEDGEHSLAKYKVTFPKG